MKLAVAMWNELGQEYNMVNTTIAPFPVTPTGNNMVDKTIVDASITDTPFSVVPAGTVLSFGKTNISLTDLELQAQKIAIENEIKSTALKIAYSPAPVVETINRAHHLIALTNIFQKIEDAIKSVVGGVVKGVENFVNEVESKL